MSRVENIPAEKKMKFGIDVDGDYGRVLSKWSSTSHDGLLKIGDPIDDPIIHNIRAVNFTGCLSDTKCTRVSFEQCSDDDVVMILRMKDPSDEDVCTAEGDNRNDYKYRLAIVDGKFHQSDGLVAIRETRLDEMDGIKCDKFCFKQCNYGSTDDSVIMGQYFPPDDHSDEIRKFVASNKAGYVIMMTSQENVNNPFIEMKIIDEGKLNNVCKNQCRS